MPCRRLIHLRIGRFNRRQPGCRDGDPPDAPAELLFETQVAPSWSNIVKMPCQKIPRQLDLSSLAGFFARRKRPAVVRGKPDESLLLTRSPAARAPQKGKELSEDEID